MPEAVTPQPSNHLPPRAPTWRNEMRETIVLGVPMALTQLGQIVMLITDTLIIGKLGTEAVAAASLATALFYFCFIIGMGIATATAPLAAQAYGAGDARGVRRVIRQGLWVVVLLGVPFMGIMWYGDQILIGLDQDPKIARMAHSYLSTLMFCTVPALWLIVLRNFVSALNRPASAMWIMLAGIPLNGFVCYGLVLGAFGLPALGIAGAGLATLIVQIIMFAAQMAIAVWARPFRQYHILRRFWVPDWGRFIQIFALGVPIAAAILCEFGVFAMAVILMGWIGTVPLASHQIALQIASLTFMIPFGIAQAATVRVGHAVGRRDALGARRAGYSALGLGIAFMALMALLMWLWRFDLPGFFIAEGDKDRPAVIELTAALLIWAAFFQMFDGAQAIAQGSLRGLSDAKVPLALAALSYWGVGLLLAYTLGFRTSLGAVGIWIGLASGLAAAALLLVVRFRRLSLNGYLPAVPQTGS
ncbi:MAG: MATE family efflux transporter [Alphaproteobacteria bacterium]